jgi:hypothetical protein
MEAAVGLQRNFPLMEKVAQGDDEISEKTEAKASHDDSRKDHKPHQTVRGPLNPFNVHFQFPMTRAIL